MFRGLITARGGLDLHKPPIAGKVIKTLRRGSKVDVLAEEAWLLVRASDGTTGFVLADHVELEAVDDAGPFIGIERAASAISTAESDVCDIRIFTGTRFDGKTIRADADFVPALQRIDRFATESGVRIHVTSSTREPGRTVGGAIVPPAKRSNHLVGHAIDMNLKSANGFFNSTKLRRANFDQLPDEIQEFLNKIRDDAVLRWGGDFSNEDPVHIDDNLNNMNPGRWDAKLASRS